MPAEPNINPLLWKAIEERRLIRLSYKDRERIVEPHDYGIHKGTLKLLAYQVGGSSTNQLPGWRWMEADHISDIQLLNRTFPGGRPASSGQHHTWERVFIRVNPPMPTKASASIRPVAEEDSEAPGQAPM